MKDTKPPSLSSKLPSNQSQPSNDKAGNPICYKCGKIGFARDCPRHLYKPRVFTLGINSKYIEAEPEPQDHQNEEGEEPSPDNDPVRVQDGEVEDQYVDNPYDPINFEIINEDDETLEAQDEPPSFNMLSFVDATGDEAIIWLVLGHASENKSAPKLGGQSSTSDLKSQATDTSSSKVPHKVINQSPPILDAKLSL